VSASDTYQQFEFAEVSRQKALTHKAFLNEKAAEHDQNMKQLLDEHLINSKKQKHELHLLELEGLISSNNMNDQRQNMEVASRRKYEQFNHQLKFERETQMQDLENSQAVFKLKLSETSKNAEHEREMDKLKLQLQIEQARRR
jgi:hypothetical protein